MKKTNFLKTKLCASVFIAAMTIVSPLQASGIDTSSTAFLQGQEIYNSTAGGVGCASCHGLDGKGTEAAPAHLGADEAKVRTALSGVAMMSMIKLKRSEIKSLMVYLNYLTEEDDIGGM